MSFLHIAIAYGLVVAAALLFIVSLCIAAGRADEESEEFLRQERERERRGEACEDREWITGPPWMRR